MGTPGEEMRRVYNAVLEAEEAAVAAVRPGVTGGELDALARGILERHGLGEAFALHAAHAGASVVVNDVDGPLAEATAATIRAHGGRAVPSAGSVADAEQANGIVERIPKIPRTPLSPLISPG